MKKLINFRSPSSLEKAFIGIYVLEIIAFVLNICGAAMLRDFFKEIFGGRQIALLSDLNFTHNIRVDWYDRILIVIAA